MERRCSSLFFFSLPKFLRTNPRISTFCSPKEKRALLFLFHAKMSRPNFPPWRPLSHLAHACTKENKPFYFGMKGGWVWRVQKKLDSNMCCHHLLTKPMPNKYGTPQPSCFHDKSKFHLIFHDEFLSFVMQNKENPRCGMEVVGWDPISWRWRIFFEIKF